MTLSMMITGTVGLYPQQAVVKDNNLHRFAKNAF